MANKPDATKFPIHISIGSHYLCKGEMAYTPAKLIGDNDWHNNRPLCKQCGIQHIIKFGEEAKWPKQ